MRIELICHVSRLISKIGIEMNIEYPLYSDIVIEIKIVAEDEKTEKNYYSIWQEDI